MIQISVGPAKEIVESLHHAAEVDRVDGYVRKTKSK
jgi:hypothetical protein